MVLMRVALPVGKNQVRIDAAFQFFEEFLHLRRRVGQKAVAIFLEDNLFFAPAGKQLGGLGGFLATLPRR